MTFSPPSDGTAPPFNPIQPDSPINPMSSTQMFLDNIYRAMKYAKNCLENSDLNKSSIEKAIIVITILNCAFVTFLKIRQLFAVRKNVKMDVKNYQTDNLIFSIIKEITMSALSAYAFHLKFYDYLHNVLSEYFKDSSEVLYNTFFLMAAVNFWSLLGLPFSITHTFGIERVHGFNNTTVSLFVKDLVKGTIVTNLFLFPLLYGILAFMCYRNFAILVCLFVIIFQCACIIIVPTFIMPLFNKFTELEDQELKKDIEELAEKCKFPLTKIQVMDASIRSGHSNAFFIGFGNKKMIVFFDTLLEQMKDNRMICGVLGHEIGHWHYNHILKTLATESILNFITFYIFQEMFHNKFITEMYKGFGTGVKILHFISIYSITSIFVSILKNMQSRYAEKQADRYAVDLNYGEDLIKGLKVLSEKNKSSGVNDWLYSYVNFSHPPLDERIEGITKDMEEVSKKKD